LKTFLAIVVVFSSLGSGLAATTINATNKFSYGANVAWMDWRGDGTNGAVIGEYVCFGYIWAASVGWIHLGNKNPANGIQYQNNSATDYGVNHDGRGNLRGFAYSGNIGWLTFTNRDATGAFYDGPKIDLLTGRLGGFVWSANAGWISLSNQFTRVQTDRIEPGADTDHDGLTDAWELKYTNTLTAFTATSDRDGDGVSDLNEYSADTNPLDPGDALRFTAFSTVFGGGNETSTFTWTTKPTRLYQLEYRTNLNSGTPWVAATSAFSPDSGTNTTRMLTLSPPLTERYFRLKALKPLSP
jgi:hypothetical protein